MFIYYQIVRKKGYTFSEVDHLFKQFVLLNVFMPYQYMEPVNQI